MRKNPTPGKGNHHFVKMCLLEIFRRFPIPGKREPSPLSRSVSWKYFGDFLYPEKGNHHLCQEVSPGNISEISYTRKKGTITLSRSVSWKYFGDLLYPEKGTSLRYEVLPLLEIFRSVLTLGTEFVFDRWLGYWLICMLNIFQW